MKIGYARVSTKDQNLELQLDALIKYECEKIFQEKQSAVKDRPELDKMLSILRKGDKVVVWKLDRLGRSLKHLIDLINDFKAKEVEFISLSDNIDTTTVQGRLVFNIFASFAEFERELISERTRAGLKAARENGRVGGKKPGLSPEAKRKALAVYHFTVENRTKPKEQRMSVPELTKAVDISRATYYRYMDWAKKHVDEPTIKRRDFQNK